MYTTYEDQWTWQILLIAFLISAAAGVVIILIVIFTCFRGNRVSLSAEHRKFDDSNEMTAQPRNATNGTPQVNGQSDLNEFGYENPVATLIAMTTRTVAAACRVQIIYQNDLNERNTPTDPGTQAHENPNVLED